MMLSSDNKPCRPGARLRDAAVRRVACRQGASILIALFYFLVCALVGGVVLTAATVTSGQLVALEKSQQAYYSTTSAAELLRDVVQGGTCTHGSGTDASAWTCTLPGERSSSLKSLSNWLGSAAQEVSGKTASSAFAAASGKSPVATAKDVVVSFAPAASTSTGSVSAVLPVSANIIMYDDYSLRIELQPKDYQEAVGSYRVVCDVPAALAYGTDEKTVEKVTWERAIISKPLSTAGVS